MKQRILASFGCLLLMSGCIRQIPYHVDQAERSQMEIEEHQYHMAAQTLTLLEKNNLEEADVLYYAEDEMELAKIIQHSFDIGQMQVSYQSDRKLDIDVVAQILCVVNPFDISLKQNDVTYTDHQDNALYTSHRIELRQTDDRYERARYEAKERLADMDVSLSMNEKIKWIHDDIIKHSVYQEELPKSPELSGALYQASGVLLDGLGVCTGYSRAFMMMAQEAGIPALYVSSESMNHGWNYVHDGKEWRYIDVTWDDPLPDQGPIVQDTFLWMDEQAFLKEGSHILQVNEQQEIHQIAQAFFSLP